MLRLQALLEREGSEYQARLRTDPYTLPVGRPLMEAGQVDWVSSARTPVSPQRTHRPEEDDRAALGGLVLAQVEHSQSCR